MDGPSREDQGSIISSSSGREEAEMPARLINTTAASHAIAHNSKTPVRHVPRVGELYHLCLARRCRMSTRERQTKDEVPLLALMQEHGRPCCACSGPSVRDGALEDRQCFAGEFNLCFAELLANSPRL